MSDLMSEVQADPDSIISFRRTSYAGGLRQPLHSHPFASVSLVLSGRVEEQVGSRTVTEGALSVVVKPAGVAHACRYSDGGVRILSLRIAAEDLQSAYPDRGLDEWRWIDSPEAAAAVLSAYRLAVEGWFSGRREDALAELLGSLAPEAEAWPARPPPWLLRVEEELRASPARPTTRALAERASVHPVHLARAFRRYFGRPPTAYARWLRIQRAAQALQDADSGSTAAYLSGYSDQSHMSREFQSVLGVTPSALQAAGRTARPTEIAPVIREVSFVQAPGDSAR